MLVTAIFNIPPLPSFPDLRARLLSFESQLTTIIPSSNSSHPTAFVTTRGRVRGRGDSFRGGRAIRGDFGRGSFFSNSGLLGPTPSSDFDGRRVQCQAKFWKSLAILLSLVVFVTGPQLLTMISPTVSLACGLLTPMIPTGIRTLVRLIIWLVMLVLWLRNLNMLAMIKLWEGNRYFGCKVTRFIFGFFKGCGRCSIWKRRSSWSQLSETVPTPLIPNAVSQEVE